jgi:putative ABC transport system permease protein
MDWAIDRLSTGERQRLALARALVFKLRILLLDEPTSALDSDNKLAVEALLREFVEAGGGIIFTTHEVDQVARAHACASTLHRRWSAVGGTDVMYIQIDDLDLLIGAALLMLNAGLSMMMQLGLARQLLVAAGRMTVQLLLVGLVLKAVFAVGSLWMTIALAVIVCLFVGFEVRARQERRLRGFWGYGLSAGAVMFVGTLVTLFALTVQIEPVLWYTPRYAIPLLGMIMGNVMTGVSLALNDIGLNVARERNSIEAQLALGATRWQALKPATRRALRSGFISIINAMAATGVVALPGMMTGQILAGVDPNEAVRYQLLVMFMIAGATSLGVYLAVFATLVRLTDERHRLRLDRLTP